MLRKSKKCKQQCKTRQSLPIDFGQWQGAAMLFLRNKHLFSKHTTSTQEQAKSNMIPASEQKAH